MLTTEELWQRQRERAKVNHQTYKTIYAACIQTIHGVNALKLDPPVYFCSYTIPELMLFRIIFFFVVVLKLFFKDFSCANAMAAAECCGVVITDDRSGDCVCTGCGRVLESHMMVGSYTDYERVAVDRQAGQQYHPAITQAGREMALAECTVQWAQEIMETCMKKAPVREETRVRLRVAACLQCACQLDGVERSEVEVAATLGLDEREVYRSTNQVRMMLMNTTYALKLCESIRPLSLVPRALQAVQHAVAPALREKIPWHALRTRIEKVAQDAERGAHGSRLEGKKPQSVCAGLLGVVLGEWDVSVETIGRVCGVSPGAIRCTMELIRPKKNVA